MSEHGRKETTRFIVSSIIGGAVITTVLLITQILVMQHMPYRDLPMMPKPIFIALLLPGVAATEVLDSAPDWIETSGFLIANVLAYAVVIAVIRGFVKAARQNPVDSK
jgi:hypothetical protein